MGEQGVCLGAGEAAGALFAQQAVGERIERGLAWLDADQGGPLGERGVERDVLLWRGPVCGGGLLREGFFEGAVAVVLQGGDDFPGLRRREPLHGLHAAQALRQRIGIGPGDRGALQAAFCREQGFDLAYLRRADAARSVRRLRLAASLGAGGLKPLDDQLIEHGGELGHGAVGAAGLAGDALEHGTVGRVVQAELGLGEVQLGLQAAVAVVGGHAASSSSVCAPFFGALIWRYTHTSPSRLHSML